ncbi:TPA: acyltransferase [Cronobacter sakazakii]|nr:acyltransferase [Cronobacter sakazakii]
MLISINIRINVKIPLTINSKITKMSIKYRPEIDGLRAIAVLSVIFYHAFPSVVTGGFVGVDIFFVISGFLITKILIKDLDSGQFSIKKFYERRARRIMPAIFFMIAVCIPFAYYYLLPNDINSFYKSLISVFTFTSNFLFASESGYFAPNVELKPLLHTWTLAVEEQFYIFFPIILFLSWKVGRKNSFFTIGFLAAISFFLADTLSITDPTNSFYLLHTRAWELLAGALGAFICAPSSKKWLFLNEIAALIGVVLIATAILTFDKTMPYPGSFTIIPVIGAFLILVLCNTSTVSGKVLSITPLKIVGLISYSAYLWHQPLFAIYRYQSINEPTTIAMFLLIATTLILAYISWRFIETPFRKPNLIGSKFIFSSTLLLSVVFISFGVAGVTYPSEMNRFTNNEIYNDVNYRLRGNFGLNRKCEREFRDYKECKTDDSPEILVWGDSYAMQIVPGILASNDKAKIVQATVSQCEPIIGYARSSTIFGAKNCIESNDRVIEMLSKTPSIKTVVISSPFPQLAASNYVTDRDGNSKIATPNDSFNMLNSTIDKVKALGKRVTIVAPTPQDKFGKDIGFCLLKTTSLGLDRSQCDFSITDESDKQREIYRRMRAISQKADVVWLKDWICNDGVCHSTMDNKLIYRDKGHLSYEGSELLGKKMNLYYSLVK